MKRVQEYQAASIAVLAGWLADHPGEETRWRLVAEFLEEYRHEPSVVRLDLLSAEPSGVGDLRWDVFLAALAEHLAAKDGQAGPPGPNRGGSTGSGFRSTLPRPASTHSSMHPLPSVAVGSSSTLRNWKSHERRPAARSGRDRRRVPAPGGIALPGAESSPTFTSSVGRPWPWPMTPADPPVTSTPSSNLMGSSSTRHAVASELGLPSWWLNEQASAYVAPGGDSSARRVFDHPGLRVSAASPEHLLAMKVLAARRRDIGDIRTLVERLALGSVDEILTLCMDMFPDEPIPERARLILEDLFSEG